jgi:hypothetical protein
MSLETYDMGNASDAYKLGVEEGAEQERAKIVAWLNTAGYRQIADKIEAKEYLK